mmetsp:Transcript_105653/g.305436  ORF Transcript_105653/g.305436 Transcript_105653/m.305436 type:complete len:577 (+) Transcript_105653:81-1811(+)
MVVPGGAGRCGGGGGGADSISKAAGDRGGRGGAASDGAPREAEADGDAAWLYHTCAAHATMLPARDIIQGALEALALAKTDEAGAQARLFDLLGDDGIETIMGVFARKDTLLTLTLADIMRFGPAANAHGQSHGHGRGHLLEDHRGLAPVPMAARRSGPSISQQITIRSQGEIDAAKRQRKDQRRAQRHAQSAGDGPGQGQDWLANLGFDEAYLEQERALGLQGGVNPDDPMGLNNLLPEGSREYHAPQALPSGTEREWREGYEWVHIPPPRRLPAPTGNELVPISSLPDWAQACFPGTKRLNRIQSALFSTAFESAENMLVCAPTGAGKTNCAMLTLLHLIGQHVDEAGVLQRSALKAVYVAPMKALAQEVVTTFSKRLAPLSLVVRELTGDMQLTRAEVDAAHLIVTTPEKWDVITRKGGSDGSLATACKLLIIDEVHLLADERGAVIESIVARTQRLVESAQTTVRIVALSATLPNYRDVAVFLRYPILHNSTHSQTLHHFIPPLPRLFPLPLPQSTGSTQSVASTTLAGSIGRCRSNRRSWESQRRTECAWLASRTSARLKSSMTPSAAGTR